MLCPLCHSKDLSVLRHKQSPGEIFHCQNCDLIFKSPDSHVDWDRQKERYDQHNNTISPGYIKFFVQLIHPLKAHMKDGDEILDWGSGPGEEPVLSQLLRREGVPVEKYDPIYQPQLPQKKFDIVTSTEVLEHFQMPRKSLQQILSFLKPRGVFAGLTQFHEGPERFPDWWYVKDATHVVFYSERTFQWIAKEFHLEILFLQNPVFIFRAK